MAAIAIFGWCLASVTFACYTWALNSCSSLNGTACQIWAYIFILHLIEMGLVAVDALFTTGFFWPLQMVIIGNGTFITLLVASLVGAAVGAQAEAEYVQIAVGALAAACFSNAMMVAMLWEHFHRASALALKSKSA